VRSDAIEWIRSPSLLHEFLESLRGGDIMVAHAFGAWVRCRIALLLLEGTHGRRLGQSHQNV
jgi:hypothetical protein